jgi:hypothetical protein
MEEKQEAKVDEEKEMEDEKNGSLCYVVSYT